MFEDYLQDSNAFFLIAEGKSKSFDERQAKRYYRASVFCAVSALEAFVNYVADSFVKAGSLSEYETAFLNDKRLYYSVEKGVIERKEFHGVDDKLRLISNRFVIGIDFDGSIWSNFQQFKDFRDSLVHPRQVDDETVISKYQAMIKIGLQSIIELMNYVSLGVFKKPLRKKLIDLIP